jgi:hypothetical protein
MRTAGALTPEQFWARMTELDDRMRASAGLMPLYGVGNWTGPVMTGDWSWEDDRLTTVGLAHGDRPGGGRYVHVQITRGDAESVVSNLRAAAHPGPRDHDQVLAMWQRLADAVPTAVDITVGGAVERFARWDDDDCWYAAGRHGGYGIVVEARDVAPDRISLVRVVDIEPYLVGRREYLRVLRGEA